MAMAIFALAVAFEPLLFGLLADVVLNLLLKRFEGLDVAGVRELLKLLHVDDRELRRKNLRGDDDQRHRAWRQHLPHYLLQTVSRQTGLLRGVARRHRLSRSGRA